MTEAQTTRPTEQKREPINTPTIYGNLAYDRVSTTDHQGKDSLFNKH